MIAYLLRRVAYSLGILLVVPTAVFVLLRLGGDPVAGFVPPGTPPEQQRVIRERFGLNRSLPAQYTSYLSRAVRGDFGESWRARRPAMHAVLDRLPATLRLTGLALVIAVAVGVPLGIVGGSRPRGAGNVLAWFVALIGQAIPGFIIGVLLILIFSVRLRWLPSSGGDGWRSTILPSLALAAHPTAIVARLLQASLRDALRADYIRTARGKGLTEHGVLFGHAMRNAFLPPLAYIGIQAGFLIGGAVVIEGVFAYPGIGSLALGAVSDRDLPVVQATVVVVAIVIVAIGFLVDLLAHLADPRLRHLDGRV